AEELDLIVQALSDSLDEKSMLSCSQAVQLANRLVSIFTADLEVFERKRYASLSHEANKAMNINSYIGLMGGKYRKQQTPQGIILTPAPIKSKSDLIIPESDFVLTLDADSVLLRDY